VVVVLSAETSPLAPGNFQDFLPQMKPTIVVNSLVAVLSAGVVYANTPLSDTFVNGDLTNSEGFEIAFASRPYIIPPLLPQLICLLKGLEHATNFLVTPVSGTSANLITINPVILLLVSTPLASNTD